MDGTPDFEQFWRAYGVHLARYGNVKHRTRPITAEIVCDHAKHFWFGFAEFEVMDIIFYFICVLGLNRGLRFDEISKLRLENVSIGRQSAKITLQTAMSSSTVERVYEIAEWYGNTALPFFVYMDPFMALFSWIVARGYDDGFLFPDVIFTSAGTSLKYEKPMSCHRFVCFMRSRLELIGIGCDDVGAYTGYSLKRGSVQLHRSLGYMDEFIMRKIGMVGPNAYANYCATYNDYSPGELPRFNSWKHMVHHAEAIAGDTTWMKDCSSFEEFGRELFGESSCTS